MIIDTCFSITTLSYFWVYLIFLTIFSSSLTLLYYTFSLLELKSATLWYKHTLKSLVLNISHDNLFETSLSKKSLSKRLIELLLDLDILHNP